MHLNIVKNENLEVISSGKCNQAAATVKCNHAGEIAGMRRLYNTIGGFQSSTTPSGFGLGAGLQRIIFGAFPQQPQAEDDSFNGMLLNKFVRLLQQFVNIAEKGGEVIRSEFRETCSQATVMLLLNLSSGSKSNVEGFSQLLRLLCWCPAYISTHDAMETGVFIWTWLVSAAPQLGALVLSELVDAWLWTIDTKRGLFASEARYCGPAAKLRPHLAPGEPESQPAIDLVEQIIAHRLWLGFLIDRFEGSADVLATLKLEYHDSATRYVFIGRTSVKKGSWEKLEGTFSLSTKPDRVIFYFEGPAPGVDLLIRSVEINCSSPNNNATSTEGCVSTGDENIIINPQFEDGLNNWSGRGCKIVLHDSMADGKIVPKSGKFFACSILWL